MSLPIRTTLEDIQTVCNYLLKKPIGATTKEAKAVLDSKHLDGRKLSAFKFWSLIEDQENLKLTPRGRQAVSEQGLRQAVVLGDVIRDIKPYHAITERAFHRVEKSITATDVAAHWHDHFQAEVSSNEKTLNDQAVCFFQLAAGAGFGELIVGRKGSPTRFEFDMEALQIFLQEDPPTTHSRAVDENSAGTYEEPVTPLSEPLQRKEELGQGIFIAHGKNKKPLEQLKGILDQFKIPYKVAVEEPNLGRPIGTKVKEIMQSCNCAILIFTADAEFQDKNGNTIWRPSENVVHELGASGFLYGNRIVILKEDQVEFPSNFQDLGYISFNKDQLEAKSVDVLKELIGFGIVKVST